ncbi:hypothetical protein FSP39_012845 [Pinctada imbricata]|uniref:CARD domain-containing protein n=1 Tax=Pinctada imbricata TaxID=66713 RepID=A0AA89C7G6_PINIB|nr:hypothetical protein FSP39_012845 [Pinctada imbricata]
MDKEQRKRITSNITFLKERLGYLDPILDNLLSKDVLSPEQRDRIDKVQPPTPHKKFNEFIQFLLASPDPGTFNSFITALEEERYFNIVEKLNKDGTGRRAQSSLRDRPDNYIRPATSVPRPITAVVKQQQQEHQESAAVTPYKEKPLIRSHTSIAKTSPSYYEDPAADEDEKSEISVPPTPTTPVPRHRRTRSPDAKGPALYVDKVTVAIGQMFAEFSGKLTNDLMDGFERRRHEEKVDIEICMEKKIEEVVEKRIDDKLTAFKGEFEKEKTELNERNEKALLALHDSIDQLRMYQDEYLQLKAKYEQLQETHSKMRDKENERWQRLSSLNKENSGLKNDTEVLRGQIIELRDRVQELESDNRALKDNEIQDQCKINQLVADKEDLLVELERTEREKMDLKLRVDSLSREIEKLLSQQQERANQDDKAYQDALKKQNDRLDELYKVVQALTDRDRQTRNLFIGGNAVTKMARTPSSRPKN